MARVIATADREAAKHLILNTKMAVRRIAAITGIGVKSKRPVTASPQTGR